MSPRRCNPFWPIIRELLNNGEMLNESGPDDRKGTHRDGGKMKGG